MYKAILASDYIENRVDLVGSYEDVEDLGEIPLLKERKIVNIPIFTTLHLRVDWIFDLADDLKFEIRFHIVIDFVHLTYFIGKLEEEVILDRFYVGD